MRQSLIHALTKDFSHVRKDGILSWEKIKKIIGIKQVTFNLQCQGRLGLQCDSTTRAMDSAIPEYWHKLTSEQQRRIIDIIQDSQNDTMLATELNQLDFPTPPEVVEQLKTLRLVDGYGRVSLVAIDKITPYLQQGDVYSEACKRADINHSDDRTGEVFPKGDLPYYGKLLRKLVIGGSYKSTDKNTPEAYFGKINNPTVHMALNQFRRVLNQLVKTYGCPPQHIHIEMARETSLSQKQLAELKSEQTQNRKHNAEIDRILLEHNVAQTYDNRMKYKLWEDLDPDISGRCCPLSGKAISLEQLFSHEIEIEHILPFSRTFDDSRNNKMVCFIEKNKEKRERTPYEAFGSTPQWEAIMARAKKMAGKTKFSKGSARRFHVNKYWRFLPDAMEQIDKEGTGFIARQLNDTKYMSRVARSYAEFVAGPNKVQAIKGKFTADLRHHWQLDQLVSNFDNGNPTKDRSNHHHHAIDALVVGLTDVRTMQKLAAANKAALSKKSSKMYLDVPAPFDGFSVKEIRKRLETLVISHKIDHKSPQPAVQSGGSIGRLHEETNYGLITDGIYATRQPLTAEAFSSHKHIETIASAHIRNDIAQLFAPHANAKGQLSTSDKKDFDEKLLAYQKQTGTKKVRVHLTKNQPLIPIYDRSGKPYRHVVSSNNFCAEIWVTDKGKKAGQWQCEIINNFAIHQKNFTPQWRRNNPTATKVMRLQINDMVAIDQSGKRRICRVQKMSARGEIILRDHNDSQSEHQSQISLSASSLQRDNARKLYVSPIGKIYDPGSAKKPTT